MLKEEDIKNRNIFVLCPGPSLLKYKDKILFSIKKYNGLTIGCNRVSHVIVPDYHMFCDRDIYLEEGDCLKKESTPIFLNKFNKGVEYIFLEKDIKTHWNGPYLLCKVKRREAYKNTISIKGDIIRSYWKGVGGLAILYAYAKGASNIYVVGMDGYSFYSEEDLSDGKASQHCYGEGFTDSGRGRVFSDSILENKNKVEYNIAVKTDKEREEVLGYIHNGGASFKIITPTVYKKYYDSTILDIN